MIILHFIKLRADSVYGDDATSLPYQTVFPKVKFKKKKRKRLTTCLMQMGEVTLCVCCVCQKGRF